MLRYWVFCCFSFEDLLYFYVLTIIAMCPLGTENVLPALRSSEELMRRFPTVYFGRLWGKVGWSKMLTKSSQNLAL